MKFLALLLIAACESSSAADITHQEVGGQEPGDRCGVPPIQCYPRTTTSTYCTNACGVAAYCPDYPQYSYDFCAEPRHLEWGRMCHNGLPTYPMDCMKSFIAAPPEN